MRRMTYFVMALALVLGFTQCKKEQPTPQTQGVRITLNVNGGNSNSRVIVDPTGNNGQYNYATVNFESGDMIYVGYNNAYVGTLTYSNGTFSGTVNISEIVGDEHLHFYFLGGVGFEPTVDGNTATVVISDQTQKLPVISYSPSKEVFTTTNTSYSAKLQNKVSIMKFNVNTPSTAPICITGVNNKVTVDFTAPSGTDNGFAYDKDGEGVIKMQGVTTENTETWAIVLPQDELPAGEEGSVYTYDNAYIGTRPAMGEIVMNTYSNSGFALEVTTPAAPAHEYVDLGLPSGLLWATSNVGADSPEDYGDYFAWGETQPKDYYDWSTYQYCHGNEKTLTKYCNNSKYGYNGFTDTLTTLLPEDDAATANWRSGWRMPTETEWLELYQKTTNIWTTQNGVNGRLFTASNGNSLFLPAAGYLDQDSLKEDGSWSYHWSSSLFMAYSVYARGFHFSSSYSNTGSAARYYGRPVRAVRSGSQN